MLTDWPSLSFFLTVLRKVFPKPPAEACSSTPMISCRSSPSRFSRPRISSAAREGKVSSICGTPAVFTFFLDGGGVFWNPFSPLAWLLEDPTRDAGAGDGMKLALPGFSDGFKYSRTMNLEYAECKLSPRPLIPVF